MLDHVIAWMRWLAKWMAFKLIKNEKVAKQLDNLKANCLIQCLNDRRTDGWEFLKQLTTDMNLLTGILCFSAWLTERLTEEHMDWIIFKLTN